MLCQRYSIDWRISVTVCERIRAVSLGLSLQLVELLEVSLLLSLIFSQLMPEIIDFQFSDDDPVLVDGVGRWVILHDESGRPQLLLRRNLRQLLLRQDAIIGDFDPFFFRLIFLVFGTLVTVSSD